MYNKQEKMYDQLFDVLNKLKSGSNSKSVSYHFELSEINSLRKKMPTVKCLLFVYNKTILYICKLGFFT